MKGIDVSRWNGVINMDSVKNAGYDFVFIRVGYCFNNGTVSEDPMFKTNMINALDAGLHVGVYLFSYALTADAGRVAARKVMEMIAPYDITMPVVFDIEDSSSVNYSAMHKDVNTAIVNAFLSTIQAGGYLGMVYASKSFLENQLNMSSIPYEVWVAHVADSVGNPREQITDYTGEFGIWQYSWVGKVSGISGNVDLNYAYRDYPARCAGEDKDEAKDPDADVDSADIIEDEDDIPEDECDCTTYTVVKNDNLTKIAARHNVPLMQLVKVNPQIKNINLIYVGEKINIPCASHK